MAASRKSRLGKCLLCGSTFIAFGPDGGRPRLYCDREHDHLYKQWMLELQRLAWVVTDTATYRKLPHGGPVRDTMRAIRRSRKVGRANKRQVIAWSRLGELEVELSRLTAERREPPTEAAEA